MLVVYSVACDPIWRTHRVQVERVIGAESSGLTLESTERGMEIFRQAYTVRQWVH